jgi:hypothetical protein
MAVRSKRRVNAEALANLWNGLDVFRADPRADANHHGMVCGKCFVEVGLNGWDSHSCGTAIG